jgi:hypothetical protein
VARRSFIPGPRGVSLGEYEEIVKVKYQRLVPLRVGARVYLFVRRTPDLAQGISDILESEQSVVNNDDAQMTRANAKGPTTPLARL